jgi:hypothetical protein
MRCASPARARRRAWLHRHLNKYVHSTVYTVWRGCLCGACPAHWHTHDVPCSECRCFNPCQHEGCVFGRAFTQAPCVQAMHAAGTACARTAQQRRLARARAWRGGGGRRCRAWRVHARSMWPAPRLSVRMRACRGPKYCSNAHPRALRSRAVFMLRACVAAAGVLSAVCRCKSACAECSGARPCCACFSSSFASLRHHLMRVRFFTSSLDVVPGVAGACCGAMQRASACGGAMQRASACGANVRAVCVCFGCQRVVPSWCVAHVHPTQHDPQHVHDSFMQRLLCGSPHRGVACGVGCVTWLRGTP